MPNASRYLVRIMVLRFNEMLEGRGNEIFYRVAVYYTQKPLKMIFFIGTYCYFMGCPKADEKYLESHKM